MMKNKKMFKFLAVLLTVPFLLIGLIFLIVIIFFSKINKNKRLQEEEDHLEYEDLSFCLIEGNSANNYPPVQDEYGDFFKTRGKTSIDLKV